MLSKLFGSTTRAEFLKIFFGQKSEEFYLREIERKSGLSIRSVQLEAEKLVDLQLLLKRIDGNRTYYAANTLHPMHKNLKEMVLQTSVVEVIEKAFADIKLDYLFLFGSAATGNMRTDSDLDLFVIGDITLRKVCQQLSEASLTLGREINPIVMGLKEFKKRIKEEDHFIKSVLQSQIKIIQGKEHDLRSMAS